MTFKMDGEFFIPASRDEVWANLNNPNILRQCIDGCEEFEATGDNSYAAIVKVRIGAIKASFKGNVTLCDLDPPNGYRIEGQGEGGPAGFAKGGAIVKLIEGEGGTRLLYTVDATIGGRLAQLGGRLVQGVSKKQADLFFSNFIKSFDPDSAALFEAAGTVGKPAPYSQIQKQPQSKANITHDNFPSFMEILRNKPVVMGLFGLSCVLIGILFDFVDVQF